MSRDAIGTFEEVVMLTVAILYSEAYGISIKQEMEKRLGRSISVGALRISLKRLEQKGYLKSHMGEVTSVRGGKRKRYYHVTPFGKKVLENVMETRKQLWKDVPDVAFDFKFI